MLIKHVLFPVYFSSPSYKTAPCVKTVALKYRTRVTFINVMHPQRMDDADTNLASRSIDAELSAGLEMSLREAFDQDFAQLSTEAIAHSGDPVDAITRFVHTHGVDLIMMPTFGHRPFRSSSLGSVAAGVLHGAQCPIWTATHADEPPALHFPCQSVVCAVDVTPKSTSVMEWAARFSRDWGARLSLVHVISPRTLRRPDEVTEAIDRMQRTVGVRAPVSVCSGEVPEEVRAEAQRRQADSLVIGRGLLDTTRGRLGRDSRGIIQRAPCPVVSI